MRVLRWISAAVLLTAVVGLQLPAATPALHPVAASPCHRCHVVAMAKKKKGKSKVAKAADKALAALGALGFHAHATYSLAKIFARARMLRLI